MPPTKGLASRLPPRYHHGMSQKTIPATTNGREPAPQAALPLPPLRPVFIDYWLIVLGFALSAYLAHIAPLPVEARDPAADPRLRTAISYLSDLMRVPEGVLLLGPPFLAVQWLRGRRQGLTSIGWLWVLSWFGVAILTGLAAWRNAFPDLTPSVIARLPWLWYLILVPSMAGLGVVLATARPFQPTAGAVDALAGAGPARLAGPAAGGRADFGKVLGWKNTHEPRGARPRRGRRQPQGGPHRRHGPQPAVRPVEEPRRPGGRPAPPGRRDAGRRRRWPSP